MSGNVGRGKVVGPAMNDKQITRLFGLALGGLLVASLVLNALAP